MSDITQAVNDNQIWDPDLLSQAHSLYSTLIWYISALYRNYGKVDGSGEVWNDPTQVLLFGYLWRLCSRVECHHPVLFHPSAPVPRNVPQGGCGYTERGRTGPWRAGLNSGSASGPRGRHGGQI